jgi:hypothetical protein
VCEAGDEVISDGSNENLRLVFQATERFAVDNAIAIALELRAYRRRFFRQLSASAQGALRGVGGEVVLPLFKAKANGFQIHI